MTGATFGYTLQDPGCKTRDQIGMSVIRACVWGPRFAHAVAPLAAMSAKWGRRRCGPWAAPFPSRGLLITAPGGPRSLSSSSEPPPAPPGFDADELTDALKEKRLAVFPLDVVQFPGQVSTPASRAASHALTPTERCACLVHW